MAQTENDTTDIQPKDLKIRGKSHPGSSKVDPREQPRSAKTIIKKVNDLAHITLSTSEIAILKARYNSITGKISDQIKLNLKDWQRLADIEIPKDIEDKIICNSKRKTIVLIREFLNTASLVAGVTALTYATTLDILKYAIPFPIIAFFVVIGSTAAGFTGSILRKHAIHQEEQETIAKLKVYQEAIEILRIMTSLEHRILRQAINTYQKLPPDKKSKYLELNIIPPYIPKIFDTQDKRTEDEEVHFLLKDHLKLSHQVAKFHMYFNEKETSRSAAHQAMPANLIEKILNPIKSFGNFLINYLGTMAATGGMWGGAMMLKDSYDHQGSWKTPEALFTLIMFMALAVTMSYWYNKHDNHKAAVHQLLIQTQKEFLKFQETYSEAVEASRYVLALANNPNAFYDDRRKY